MLGNIARKLLLLGFDTEYYSDIDDLKLISKAKNEQRTIISKDQELIARAKKQDIVSVHVTKEDEIEQFLEILEHIPLELDTISGDTARCTKCNSPTLQIDKSKISGKIPQKVLEFNDKFWKCESCNQIYWEGTHIKKLQEFLEKVKLGRDRT
ncbi:MAG: Mut7-C RNAse domain-containing protein [Nitrosopumilus sp.]|nr:Mut7-C RNAse domain-containing protein [Nitrosopumilus sp.]